VLKYLWKYAIIAKNLSIIETMICENLETGFIKNYIFLQGRYRFQH